MEASEELARHEHAISISMQASKDLCSVLDPVWFMYQGSRGVLKV